MTFRHQFFKFLVATRKRRLKERRYMLAARLEVSPTTLAHWISGAHAPRPLGENGQPSQSAKIAWEFGIDEMLLWSGEKRGGLFVGPKEKEKRP